METVKDGRFEFTADQWPMDKEKTTLIFIHGAGMNCRSWDSQVTGLSPHANVIAVNLPGRGQSDKDACDSIEENADHVLDFMDDNQIKDPIVCGLSMGGAIVLSLLCRNSGKIKAGVVINSGARLRINDMIFNAIEYNYSAYVQSIGQFAICPKNDSEQLRARLNDTIISNKDSALKDFQACNAFDVMEELDTLSTPVLILTASDDLITPAKYGEHLKRTIPNARLFCIKDAGHLSPMETPEAVNREIAGFINSI